MNRRNFPKLTTEQGRVYWLLAGRVLLINGDPTYVPDVGTVSEGLPATIGLPEHSITIESLDGGNTWGEVDNANTT